jgi:hypothetical protein
MSAPTLEDIQERLKLIQIQMDLSARGGNLPSVVNSETTAPPEPGTTPRSPSDSKFTGVINGLDIRIIDAPPQEMPGLLYVRDQIIRQEETLANGSHVRELEKKNFYAKVALSFCAFAGGLGLVVTGFGLPGFVCLGAGLYAIAPNFIDRVTGQVIGKNKP